MSHSEHCAQAGAFESAMGLMLQKRWAEAEVEWQALRGAVPDHPTPWLQGAISLLRQNDLKGAGALLHRAREKFAGHAQCWIVSAEWALQSGDEALEAELLQQGRARLGDNRQLLCKLAEVFERRGEHDRASESIARALAQRPEEVELLLRGVSVAEGHNDWATAERYLKRLLKLQRGSRDCLRRLANAYLQMGDGVQAKRYRLAAEYGESLLEAPIELQVSDRKPKRLGAPWHFLQMVLVKSWFNLKSESYGMHLNHAWVVIEPLLHLIIYYFLFGKVLNAGVDDYGLFLLCGLVPWMWFTKSISSCSTSVVGGQALMLSCNMPAVFFPLVAVVRSTFKQLPPLALLLLMGAATSKETLSGSLLYLPLIIALQFLLTAVVGVLAAAAVAFVRDLANLVGTGLLLLMFLSGVIYNASTLSPEVASVVERNPMTLVISAYRNIIIAGEAPDFAALSYVMMCILGGSLLAYGVYRTQGSQFVRRGMI